mgnify:CR=1 FL=1
MWFFFGTYIFLVSIVFQDIVTGVVMDAFEHIHAEESDDDDYDDGMISSQSQPIGTCKFTQAKVVFMRCTQSRCKQQ